MADNNIENKLIKTQDDNQSKSQQKKPIMFGGNKESKIATTQYTESASSQLTNEMGASGTRGRKAGATQHADRGSSQQTKEVEASGTRGHKVATPQYTNHGSAQQKAQKAAMGEIRSNVDRKTDDGDLRNSAQTTKQMGTSDGKKRMDPKKQNENGQRKPWDKTRGRGRTNQLDRCYGWFHCDNCGSGWESSHVYCSSGSLTVRYRQKCKKCFEWMFPVKTELIKCHMCGLQSRECHCYDDEYDDDDDDENDDDDNEDDDNNNNDDDVDKKKKKKKKKYTRHVNPMKPHLSELCEKCQSGRPCQNEAD